MINIKVYTKNKKTGAATSSTESSSTNNINAGGGGGGGSWLEKYFIYDSAQDCIICKRKLGSNDNIIGFMPVE